MVGKDISSVGRDPGNEAWVTHVRFMDILLNKEEMETFELEIQDGGKFLHLCLMMSVRP